MAVANIMLLYCLIGPYNWKSAPQNCRSECAEAFAAAKPSLNSFLLLHSNVAFADEHPAGKPYVSLTSFTVSAA